MKSLIVIAAGFVVLVFSNVAALLFGWESASADLPISMLGWGLMAAGAAPWMRVHRDFGLATAAAAGGAILTIAPSVWPAPGVATLIGSVGMLDGFMIMVSIGLHRCTLRSGHPDVAHGLNSVRQIVTASFALMLAAVPVAALTGVSFAGVEIDGRRRLQTIGVLIIVGTVLGVLLLLAGFVVGIAHVATLFWFPYLLVTSARLPKLERLVRELRDDRGVVPSRSGSSG